MSERISPNMVIHHVQNLIGQAETDINLARRKLDDLLKHKAALEAANIDLQSKVQHTNVSENLSLEQHAEKLCK